MVFSLQEIRTDLARLRVYDGPRFAQRFSPIEIRKGMWIFARSLMSITAHVTF
jgi:hypothetical protein